MNIPSARIIVPGDDIEWILSEIRGALKSGQLTLGKHVRAFEEAFAAYLGVADAVAVGSGTAALEIILRGLDVAGKEVIVPANTFFATAAAVAHAKCPAILRRSLDDRSSQSSSEKSPSVGRLHDSSIGAVCSEALRGEMPFTSSTVTARDGAEY